MQFWTIKDINYIAYEKIGLTNNFNFKDLMRYIRKNYNTKDCKIVVNRKKHFVRLVDL